MLLSSTRHAFIVSADEIMFLKFEMRHKCEYDTPHGNPIDTICEPWLSYSSPIKFEQLLDTERGTISANLGLLHSLYNLTQVAWELPEDMGSSLNYAARTNPGENWMPKLSWL
jgi:hypothetical protein